MEFFAKDSDKKESAPKSFARRDHLIELQQFAQKKWEDEKVFETERKVDENGNDCPKFLVTFPYPYMNGRLHLGHAFSLTKAEFMARFQRLNGKNVLFPFGFHCTGMPIQAAANKLKRELATYGNPPVFPDPEEELADQLQKTKVEEQSAESQIAAKSKGKRTKLASKGMLTDYQYNIMKMMVPEEEIPEFVDPLKWLNYFPPYGISDLKAFGTCVDWRRSFITTSVNEYYDAFIRWQFNKLRQGGRIKFGKRPSIYSILDGQVCADHDRTGDGLGVGPQEYTIVKLRVLDIPSTHPLAQIPSLKDKLDKIYLAAATFRPETMYGQTNCFVLPTGTYGAYELRNGDIVIISHRSARGFSCQDLLKASWGQEQDARHGEVQGSDLLGMALSAPRTPFERIYTLPLLTISMGKGTGVVTSVPSDAPDDYVALKELQDKPLWREKWGITDEMVMPFDVVPIIEIEGHGNMMAKTMCDDMKIKSCKDTEKLKLVKDETYKKGFYEGVMIVGPYAGTKVCDAKPLEKADMIKEGNAFLYYEPEKLVMSRTGDECVVALLDQWFLEYGEESWMNAVSEHLHSENFQSYNVRIMQEFDKVVAWLKEWACCRQMGLGTQLPWDEQFVIESLSDSTIYMAYYTIAHILQGKGQDLSGKGGDMSEDRILPSQLTDGVFDFIFLNQPLPSDTTLSEAQLLAMRAEFEYWYPMDLRVSAHDLIPNHLTMCLYNHLEIWKDRPEMWPRGVYCNGHIMVNKKKMSKSEGNFLMLLQCCEEFSADATRFALANSGDSLEDANFEPKLANEAILYLHNCEDWIKSALEDSTSNKLRGADSEMFFMDQCFLNEINYICDATKAKFEAMTFRDGLTLCWYELMIARDMYRDWAVRVSIPMHDKVVRTFVNALVIMMAPITPHWCEHMWCNVLVNTDISSTVCNASWPSGPYDPLLRKQYYFFRDTLKNARLSLIKASIAKIGKDSNKVIGLQIL
jgi:leucyl-tRNA synthetase